MAGSGLQILVAYPFLGPRGALVGWYPFQGKVPPEWMRLGGWLAGARHWHFAVVWLFAVNALTYVTWLAAGGEWRRRLFLPWRDGPEMWRAIRAYARFREAPTSYGPYNGLQRFAYTMALGLGVLIIGSGLSLYKPVQLSFFARLFGGYEGARAIHLLSLVAFTIFTIGHVILVILHPREFVLMTVGGTRPESTEVPHG
jgi:thiosulfate reductase cytochrome b subunit